MCGITGFTGKQDKNILKKMVSVIEHRGPDEDGYYSDDSINLGMSRLSIIDLETGQQPSFNEDKNICTIFNGEIYNYIELRDFLAKQGHKFYTNHSDTEVISHLYEEEGLGFPHKMNGMFAIALWNKNKEELILIRDRMGVKPLFYSLIKGEIIFGSEIKSILQHPAYKKDINYEAIYHYFTFRNIPAPMTAFKNIFSLLPGEMLIFSKGEIRLKRWWKINFNVEQQTDEAFIKKNILHLLENATEIRMRSDVPYGAFLSGGVDSSVIVALMSRHCSGRVKTFSLGYEEQLKNKEADLFHARRVSKKFNTEHYEYIMSYKELIQELPAVIRSFDQPFSGTISTYFLSKLIKKHVKVALSGDGADELFGSYLSHRTAQSMFYFRKLYDKYKSNTLSLEDKKMFMPCDIQYLDNLYFVSQGNEIDWRYQLYLFSDKEKSGLFSENLKKELKDVASYSIVKDYFKNITAKDPLNRILEMEWNTQLPDQVLAFVDFLSMANSVEVRSPFLDYKLVEFSASIPGNFKIRNGIVKDILKNAVEHLLPEDITKRPKEGFVLPVYDWMTEKLKNYSYETLSSDRLDKHGFFNKSNVNELLYNHYINKKSNPAKIWTLINFQIWWELHF